MSRYIVGSKVISFKGRVFIAHSEHESLEAAIAAEIPLASDGSNLYIFKLHDLGQYTISMWYEEYEYGFREWELFIPCKQSEQAWLWARKEGLCVA